MTCGGSPEDAGQVLWGWWEFRFSVVGELPGGEGKWPRGRYALGPGLSQVEVGVSILFPPSFHPSLQLGMESLTAVSTVARNLGA